MKSQSFKTAFFRGFLGLFVSLGLVSLTNAADKKSLTEYAQNLKNPGAIAEFFRSTEFTKDQNKQLKKLFKDNEPNFKALLADFDASTNFHRGEIEDEKTLNGVINYLQLSILEIRYLTAEKNSKNWPEVESIFKSWFQFSADFPYEEASLVGLRVIGVARSFLFDEVERLQEKYHDEIAKNDYLRKQFLAFRAPWPIDRVIVTEAKKVLRKTPMQVAEKLAKDLQKNPYQTSEAGLKKIKGGMAKELDFLKEIWREKDIDLMKTEITRIGQIKLKLASGAYQAKTGKKPEAVSELISAGFLDRVPLDYKTGKAIEL